MDRLIAANSVPQAQADTAPATGTPQFSTDGNPATGVPATLWPSYQYNAIQEELIALISAGGLTPDKTNNAQLRASILAMFRDGKAIYAVGTGTANAIAIALSPAPTALTDGMVFRVKAANDNTGATTVNPNTLGNIPAYANGAAMVGGEIKAGGYYEFEYDATNAVLHLIGASKGELAVSAGTSSGHAVNLGQFLSSLSAVGYQELPSGLIVQWGVSTLTTSSTGTSGGVSYNFSTAAISFPIVFPNGVFSITANATDIASTAFNSVSLFSISASGFSISSKTTANGSVSNYWIAIGW